MTTDRMGRELRWLRLYVLASLLLTAVMTLGGFSRPAGEIARFDEIQAHRINIVESDGTIRLVLANRSSSPGALLNGKKLSPDGQRPGMIFYNDEGDEVGGLTFAGRRDSAGYRNSGSLTFDQFKQDQVVALQHIDNNGRRFQGLTILDRPDVALDWVIEESSRISAMPAGPARDSARRAWVDAQGGAAYGVPRLFVGRDQSKASSMRMHDPQGRPRLRLTVDSLGMAAIEFLNDSGRVVHRVTAP
jgi:hypothetical protein